MRENENGFRIFDTEEEAKENIETDGINKVFIFAFRLGRNYEAEKQEALKNERRN